jgi:hypothetical protein
LGEREKQLDLEIQPATAWMSLEQFETEGVAKKPAVLGTRALAKRSQGALHPAFRWASSGEAQRLQKREYPAEEQK